MYVAVRVPLPVAMRTRRATAHGTIMPRPSRPASSEDGTRVRQDDPMRIDPRIATVLAVILIIVGGVIVATSGDSISVRFLTALVTLDVAIRLYSRNAASDRR
jgi:hypothetical protein